MGLYNFKPQFEADIMADRKRHTIRAKRKYPDKPGNLLSLYVGLRTKKTRLLKRRRCTRVQDIQIRTVLMDRDHICALIKIDGQYLETDAEMELFAQSDGFKGLYEFVQFWETTHQSNKTPFHGDLIHWESDTENQKREDDNFTQYAQASRDRRRKQVARKKQVAKHL